MGVGCDIVDRSTYALEALFEARAASTLNIIHVDRLDHAGPLLRLAALEGTEIVFARSAGTCHLLRLEGEQRLRRSVVWCHWTASYVRPVVDIHNLRLLMHIAGPVDLSLAAWIR